MYFEWCGIIFGRKELIGNTLCTKKGIIKQPHYQLHSSSKSLKIIQKKVDFLEEC